MYFCGVNNQLMKQLFTLLIVAVSILALASCKTHEKCPAYGKVNPAQSTKRA